MYLEDIFTEKLYTEIKNNFIKRKPFEKKLVFGKYTFEIGLDRLRNEKSYLDLWGEPYIVNIGYSAKNEGGGWGEKVEDVLSNFYTYQKACNYLHNETPLKYAEKKEPKYQGIKYGSMYEQITLF